MLLSCAYIYIYNFLITHTHTHTPISRHSNLLHSHFPFVARSPWIKFKNINDNNISTYLSIFIYHLLRLLADSSKRTSGFLSCEKTKYVYVNENLYDENKLWTWCVWVCVRVLIRFLWIRVKWTVTDDDAKSSSHAEQYDITKHYLYTFLAVIISEFFLILLVSIIFLSSSDGGNDRATRSCVIHCCPFAWSSSTKSRVYTRYMYDEH